jgi:predicted transcriptional regulator
MSNSKFYPKSLTLLLPILEMINEGCISRDIATRLGISKQLVFYHIKKAKESGFVTEVFSDTFKTYELTQPGKNFLAMYQQEKAKAAQQQSMPICRAENVRFKASVYKMPSKLVDLHRVEMHNWNQYTTEVGSIKVKLNDGDDPTIEFIPSAIDGSDPLQLYFRIFSDCNEVANNLEQTLDMRIGRLELSSKAEWVIYNPLAKAITNKIGRVTVEGVGMINASLPDRHGEFEFHDPRAAAEFLDMSRRFARLEQQQQEQQTDVDEIKQDIKEVLDLVKQERSYSEVKSGETPDEETR